MTPISRRATLRLGGGALAALALPGCAGPGPPYPVTPVTDVLLDAHSHLFNGQDLPVTKFITQVVLGGTSGGRCELPATAGKRQNIEDPTLFERLVELMVDWLLQGTPTAAVERDRLQRDRITTVASETARVTRVTRKKLAAFLDTPAIGALRDTDTRLRQALLDEVRTSARNGNLTPRSARQAAADILRSSGRFGTFLRWIGLFFRSRQSLAQELVTASRSWGREPLMLVPLMVDYAHWLGETTRDCSSFYDQIEVWGALSRRSPIPVHGMVPFDPLRSVFWTTGRRTRFPETTEFDPLDLAERALGDHGFLGLKLYPPMGFSATGNLAADSAYRPEIIRALGLPQNRLGAELDRAMARAFDFCVQRDAPMIAHANNSVASGSGYGRRAEPRYWIDALRRWPTLRLCLAHGGGFCWRQTGAASGAAEDRASWEWAIGAYVRGAPASHLYMDVSYSSEVMGQKDRLDWISRQLRDWIATCDPEARHLVFGTDWVMLGREPGYERYGLTVQAFLTDRIGLSADQLDRVMWGNAMRFLGLDQGARSRERLLAFYGNRRPALTRRTPP